MKRYLEIAGNDRMACIEKEDIKAVNVLDFKSGNSSVNIFTQSSGSFEFIYESEKANGVYKAIRDEIWPD